MFRIDHSWVVLGFLDHEFDLNGTPFNKNDLQIARDFWNVAIDKVRPDWRDLPIGYLAPHWESSGKPSAVRLISLAKIISTIPRKLDKQSLKIFENKLSDLLGSDGIQYKELCTEFIVCAQLTRLSRSITFEPESTEVSGENSINKNVDFSLDWNNIGTIYCESTVFHIQKILDWESARNNLRERFTREMLRKKLNRNIKITAPLELTNHTLSIEKIRHIQRIVEKNERGKYSIKLNKEKLDLEWSPIPTFEKNSGSAHKQINPRFELPKGAKSTISASIAIPFNLKWPGDAEKVVYKSLTNTQDNKRQQFQLESPYILYLRIYNYHIPKDVISNLIHRRIYKNKKYKWISAIALMKVDFGSNIGIYPKITYSQNPFAKFPIPKTFLESLCK